MLLTNIYYLISELMLHSKMCHVQTYVTHDNMIPVVRTYVTYENVL